MGSLIFFIKTMAITLIVVVLLQIKVGNETLEDKTLHFVYTSDLTTPLREAAEGGVVFIRDLWNKIAGNINTEFSRAIESKNRPGERRIGINLERSKEYLKEKSQRAAEVVKDRAESAARNIREEFEREGIIEEHPQESSQ